MAVVTASVGISSGMTAFCEHCPNRLTCWVVGCIRPAVVDPTYPDQRGR